MVVVVAHRDGQGGRERVLFWGRTLSFLICITPRKKMEKLYVLFFFLLEEIGFSGEANRKDYG